MSCTNYDFKESNLNFVKDIINAVPLEHNEDTLL